MFNQGKIIKSLVNQLDRGTNPSGFICRIIEFVYLFGNACGKRKRI